MKDGFRRAMRTVAVLLVAAGIFGAGWGLWVVAQLVWYADVGSLLEVSSTAWAGLAGAQIAVFAVLPSLAVAWLGWRWWSSPARFSVTRRLVLYVVLAAGVVAAAIGLLLPSWPLVGLAGAVASVTLAAIVAGFRAGEALIAEADPRARPVPWGRAFVLAALIVLLTSGLSAAVASVHDVGGDLFEVSYRDDVVACRGPVDASCAAEAARRSQLPVAWLPDAHERKSRAVVVMRRPSTPMPLRAGSVFQEGRDGWVRFDLQTNPGEPDSGRPVGTVRAGATTAEMRVDATNGASFVYLDWTHDDVPYRLTAYRLTDAMDSVTAAAKRMLGDVRYTSP